MYNINELFTSFKTSSPILSKSTIVLIKHQQLSINKQFEEAIETYNKTKIRKKIVGIVTISD